jgi:ribonuclease P protein component
MAPQGHPAAGSQRFGKEDRLLLRPEFRRAAAEGSRRVSDHFIVYISRNKLGRPRLGITASRKVGTAVVRNRVKRLVREYFRTSRDRLPASRDILVIARKTESEMKLADLARELDRLIGVKGQRSAP